MKRVLVTGASGFAGRHLVAECLAAGDDVDELARGRGARVDLLDAAATASAISEAQPEVVYHLAARAHVGESWEQPAQTLHDNLTMTQNVLDAVRAGAPDAVVVAVASGEVYGPPETLPVDESAALRPQNPYAVSKASADLLAGFYADAYGVRVVRARAFNHAGPGQAPSYAIATFARQVAEGLEAGDGAGRVGGGPITVITGNPDTRRDFTDVRDVVRAYRALAADGVPGEAYNVCSGHPASAAELVGWLGEATGVPVELQVDPAKVRAHEVMELRGSHAKLTAATGWEPAIPLRMTLGDTVRWWREELRAGR